MNIKRLGICLMICGLLMQAVTTLHYKHQAAYWRSHYDQMKTERDGIRFPWTTQCSDKLCITQDCGVAVLTTR